MTTPIPLIGYAPDMDQTTPGIITSCANFIPTKRGYRSAPRPASSGYPALAAACKGAAVLKQLDDTSRLFAGTSTNIYEGSSSAWTSRYSGASLAATEKWRFAIFGNIELAIARSENLLESSTAAFSAVAGAPKASIVEVVGEQVIVFDYNDGVNDVPDGWYCSALGTYDNWTRSNANSCASGRLRGTPGAVKAGKRFGRDVIAYKEQSMAIGRFGGPFIWDFEDLPGTAGALSQEVVIDTGNSDEPRHYFMGYDDFYMFAGSRAISIGGSLREEVFNQLNRSYAYLCTALHDRNNDLIYWFYPSGESLDKCVVYNYSSDKWGRDDRSIEEIVQYIAPGITYDNIGATYSPYDNFPNVSYNTAFMGENAEIPGIFDTSSTLQLLNGPATSSAYITGDYGDDQDYTFVSRVLPRFLEKPESGQMTNYYRNALGDDLTAGEISGMSESRFDITMDARYHRFAFEYEGPMEITANAIEGIGGGLE